MSLELQSNVGCFIKGPYVLGPVFSAPAAPAVDMVWIATLAALVTACARYLLEFVYSFVIFAFWFACFYILLLSLPLWDYLVLGLIFWDCLFWVCLIFALASAIVRPFTPDTIRYFLPYQRSHWCMFKSTFLAMCKWCYLHWVCILICTMVVHSSGLFT